MSEQSRPDSDPEESRAYVAIRCRQGERRRSSFVYGPTTPQVAVELARLLQRQATLSGNPAKFAFEPHEGDDTDAVLAESEIARWRNMADAEFLGVPKGQAGEFENKCMHAFEQCEQWNERIKRREPPSAHYYLFKRTWEDGYDNYKLIYKVKAKQQAQLLRDSLEIRRPAEHSRESGYFEEYVLECENHVAPSQAKANDYHLAQLRFEAERGVHAECATAVDLFRTCCEIDRKLQQTTAIGLSENQKSLVIAMLNMKAFDPASRQKAIAIVKVAFDRQAIASSYKGDFSTLKRLGLASSAKGPSGGSYLTAKGKTVAESLRPA